MLQDAVNGGILVIEVDDLTGAMEVIARCPNTTRASQIITALSS